MVHFSVFNINDIALPVAQTHLHSYTCIKILASFLFFQDLNSVAKRFTILYDVLFGENILCLQLVPRSGKEVLANYARVDTDVCQLLANC